MTAHGKTLEMIELSKRLDRGVKTVCPGKANNRHERRKKRAVESARVRAAKRVPGLADAPKVTALTHVYRAWHAGLLKPKQAKLLGIEKRAA